MASTLGLEQAFVGGVAHQGVLEQVGRIRRRAAPEHQLGLDQSLHGVAQRRLRQLREGGDGGVVEGAADHGRGLRHLLDRVQPVQPRHNESCRLAGIARPLSGPPRRYASAVSSSDPDSSTALVISSTNSGTPSLRTAISSSSCLRQPLATGDPLDDELDRGARQAGSERGGSRPGGWRRKPRTSVARSPRPAPRCPAPDPAPARASRGWWGRSSARPRPPTSPAADRRTRSAGRPGRPGCGRGVAAA